MSIKPLVYAWAAMMGFLALTIGASFLPLGHVLPFVSYGLAIAKAALVLWFFMELRSEPGLPRLAIGAGFVWLAFLLTMIASDVLGRSWFGN